MVIVHGRRDLVAVSQQLCVLGRCFEGDHVQSGSGYVGVERSKGSLCMYVVSQRTMKTDKGLTLDASSRRGAQTAFAQGGTLVPHRLESCFLLVLEDANELRDVDFANLVNIAGFDTQ
jgi:hypothetical protein